MISRAWVFVALLGCKSSGSVAPAAGSGSGSGSATMRDAGKLMDAPIAQAKPIDAPAAPTKSIEAAPSHEPRVEGEMDGPSDDDLAEKNESDEVEAAILDYSIAEQQKANPKFSRNDAIAAISKGGGPRVSIPSMMRRRQADCARNAHGLDEIAACLKPLPEQQ